MQAVRFLRCFSSYVCFISCYCVYLFYDVTSIFIAVDNSLKRTLKTISTNKKIRFIKDVKSDSWKKDVVFFLKIKINFFIVTE